MNYCRPVGYNLKSPSTYFPSIEILENSNRNANGDLIREIIANKVKLNMSWNYMTQNEISVLTALRKLGKFTCDYLDLDGTYKTIEAYCGDISATPVHTNNGFVTDWQDVTCNFIEL